MQNFKVLNPDIIREQIHKYEAVDLPMTDNACVLILVGESEDIPLSYWTNFEDATNKLLEYLKNGISSVKYVVIERLEGYTNGYEINNPLVINDS